MRAPIPSDYPKEIQDLLEELRSTTELLEQSLSHQTKAYEILKKVVNHPKTDKQTGV